MDCKQLSTHCFGPLQMVSVKSPYDVLKFPSGQETEKVESG